MEIVKFYAKDDGTTLREHSIDVYKKACVIINLLGIKDKVIIDAICICALVHDIGKTASIFQKYLETKQTENFPRHNEIGFALLNVLIDSDFGLHGNKYKLNELIKYAVLYHHEIYNEKSNLSNLYNNDELIKISEYYNSIFKEVGLSSVIRFKNEFDIMEDDDVPVGDIKTLKFIEVTDSNKNNLYKLAIFELIFNIVRHADLLVSSNCDYDYMRPSKHITNNSLTFPSHFDRCRWDEQNKKAKEAFETIISVLDATMGWGKTLCGIIFLLSAQRRGFWVCPDNNLAEATYNSICDMLNTCGIGELKVSLVLSGSYRGYPIDDADIVVINIDTYCNGVFRNMRKDISCEALMCNTIFDEYHEYAFDNNPLLVRFKTILEARKYCEETKTLLLSGTVINKGYINSSNIIKADKLEMDKHKKVRIHYITKDEFNRINDFSNSFIINTSIKSCQYLYKTKNIDTCFHSEFDEEDLTRHINEIMSHNGKNGDDKKCSVSGTSSLSRGMDMSFMKCYLINPSPLTIEQVCGRLSRWDISIITDLYIIIDDTNRETMIHGKDWENYYKPYLTFLKDEVNNKTISTYELKEYRKKFFENENDIKHSFEKMIRDNMKESIKKLSQIEFCKGMPIEKQDGNTGYIKDSMDVRGNSINRFFIVQKEGEEFGVMSGVICIPYYRFGWEGEFEKLKNNKYIIENIKKYFIKFPHLAEIYDIKNIKKWKNENLFNKLMRMAKCSDTPFPILCDYIYNSNIGFENKIK